MKERKTRVKLLLNNTKQTEILIDDKAATRQAIINYIKNNKLPFLARSDWHAKDARAKLDPEWDYDSIVIHHQGNSGYTFSCGNFEDDLKDVQAEHMNPKGAQKFDDIGYHYAVHCDGHIAECRDIRFKGSHVNDNNSKKIGILLIGDYSERGEVSWGDSGTRNFLKDNLDFFNSISIPIPLGYSLIVLVEALVTFFNIEMLGGHREFSLPSDKRTCPGNIGMKMVEYLRNLFKLRSPKQ